LGTPKLIHRITRAGYFFRLPDGFPQWNAFPRGTLREKPGGAWLADLGMVGCECFPNIGRSHARVRCARRASTNPRVLPGGESLTTHEFRALAVLRSCRPSTGRARRFDALAQRIVDGGFSLSSLSESPYPRADRRNVKNRKTMKASKKPSKAANRGGFKDLKAKKNPKGGTDSTSPKFTTKRADSASPNLY
jgi:hypothetical protein